MVIFPVLQFHTRGNWTPWYLIYSLLPSFVAVFNQQIFDLPFHIISYHIFNPFHTISSFLTNQVVDLLVTMGEDVDGKGQDGSTPLRCAVQVGFIIFVVFTIFLKYFHYHCPNNCYSRRVILVWWRFFLIREQALPTRCWSSVEIMSTTFIYNTDGIDWC